MTDRNPLLQTATGPANGERAVSEVLAFILVFGIILTSVALLFGFGFQAVEDVQELEQTNNAERAMAAVADNFNDVLRYDGVNERFSEVSLRDGTIATGDDGTEVDINYGAIDETVELGEFEYRGDSETIVYDGGGVLRSADTGSAMVKQPRMRYNEDSNTATISLTEVNATSRTFQGSDGVGVRMSVEDNGDARSKAFEEDSGDLDMTIDTEYPRAWERAAERGGWPESWIDVDEANGEVTIDSSRGSGEVDRLVVHVVTVDIEIESGV